MVMLGWVVGTWRSVLRVALVLLIILRLLLRLSRLVKFCWMTLRLLSRNMWAVTRVARFICRVCLFRTLSVAGVTSLNSCDLVFRRNDDCYSG